MIPAPTRSISPVSFSSIGQDSAVIQSEIGNSQPPTSRNQQWIFESSIYLLVAHLPPTQYPKKQIKESLAFTIICSFQIPSTWIPHFIIPRLNVNVENKQKKDYEYGALSFDSKICRYPYKRWGWLSVAYWYHYNSWMCNSWDIWEHIALVLVIRKLKGIHPCMTPFFLSYKFKNRLLPVQIWNICTRYSSHFLFMNLYSQFPCCFHSWLFVHLWERWKPEWVSTVLDTENTE